MIRLGNILYVFCYYFEYKYGKNCIYDYGNWLECGYFIMFLIEFFRLWFKIMD